MLSSGCGVYHGHAGSSSSRLLRLSLGASGKRVVAATSSGGLLGRSSHHLMMAPSQSVPLEVNPSSPASPSASFCDLKTKRKIREHKTIKSNNRASPSGPCPVMPREPMTDGVLLPGKNSRPSPSRRPLTRSVLRASLSPLAGPGSPSASGASKKSLVHHGSMSVKPSNITHPRRLLASHTPLPK